MMVVVKREETVARLKELLRVSPYGELRMTMERFVCLSRGGLVNNPRLPFDWDSWDDEYNGPVPNGRDRTPAQFVLDWMLWLVGNDEDPKFHLWMHGPTGRGKTHLAVAMATIWAITQEVSGRITNWSTRLDALKESFSSGEEVDPFSEEIGTDILVMDDVGTERVTLFNLKALYRIVDGRQGKPTIWTSNWTLEAFHKKILQSDKPTDDRMAVMDLGTKIGDRLSWGKGGYVASRYFLVDAPVSYRRLPR
jgi:hypothetical protein